MNHFSSIKDVPNPELLLRDALQIKNEPNAYRHVGQHKTLAMLFFNNSLRTRMSTELAAKKLGMDVCVLNAGNDSWKMEFEKGAKMNADTAEHIIEGAGVMGRYADIIGIRSFASLKDKEADYAEKVLTAFKDYSSKKVMSMESATLHPLQSLADMLTIEEYRLKLANKDKLKVVMTWAPHPKALPQAVPNSFVEWMKDWDKVDLTVTHPEGYDLAPEFIDGVDVTYDQAAAMKDADIVYVKNWSAYNDYGKVLSQDENWTFSKKQWDLTNQAKVMHCLPVRRNMVIADDILDSEHSVVLDEAENRLYAAMAVLKNLIENK